MEERYNVFASWVVARMVLECSISKASLASQLAFDGVVGLLWRGLRGSSHLPDNPARVFHSSENPCFLDDCSIPFLARPVRYDSRILSLHLLLIGSDGTIPDPVQDREDFLGSHGLLGLGPDPGASHSRSSEQRSLTLARSKGGTTSHGATSCLHDSPATPGQHPASGGMRCSNRLCPLPRGCEDAAPFCRQTNDQPSL